MSEVLPSEEKPSEEKMHSLKTLTTVVYAISSSKTSPEPGWKAIFAGRFALSGLVCCGVRWVRSPLSW
jgi:hypothetical protein